VVGEAAARTAVGRWAAVRSLSAIKSPLNQEGRVRACVRTMLATPKLLDHTGWEQIHLVHSKEQREQLLASSFLLCFYLSISRFSKYAENVGIIPHR